MRRHNRLHKCSAHARATAALFAVLALVTPAVTFAQELAPPQPTLNRYPQPWIGFMIIFVLLAMVIAVSLLPSKRGHQD